MRLFTKLILLPALILGAGDSAVAASALTWQQTISFMESADSARIFTVDPEGKRGPAHVLDRAARKAFVAFISNPDNFGRPLGMPIAPPEVGIEFQKGARKLAVYTTWGFGYFYDRFPKSGDTAGFSFLAVLGPQGKLAQAWQQKYFPRPVYSPR